MRRMLLASLAGLVLLSGLAEAQQPTLVRDIWPGANSSNPHALATMGNTLFFAAEDDPFSTGMALWKTDGTIEGTVFVFPFPPGTIISEARAWNGALYFAADDRVRGDELWRSDGTFQGTSLFFDAVGGPGGPRQFTPSGRYLYFTQTDALHGLELWRTDGTPQGTLIVADIGLGALPSAPRHLVDFNGVLLFVAGNQFVGDELWRTDGTPEGTYLVRDIRPGVLGSGISEIAVVGDRAFFAADDGFNGMELWSTDGTELGTQRWQPEIQPGPGSSSPTGLTAMRGELFFAADDGISGRELWRLDPSMFAPERVADIRPGSGGSNPTLLRDVEGQLFFVADDGQIGAEPYVSDGTLQSLGTALVQDIAPGPQSSSPQGLTNVNGSLVFRADNGFEGAEPWSSRSPIFLRPNETFHWDLHPGFPSSGPAQFTRAGDRLFFTADDGFRGNELWTFDNRPPVAQAGPDQTVEPGATVLLSAIESTDPDDPIGVSLSYEWRDFDNRVLGRWNAVEVPNFQPGATEYTLIVRDGLGGRSEDTVKVSTPGRTVPVVTILSPANGETLIVGSTFEIQWTVADPESIVQSRVLLSTDGGTSYLPVCTGGPGSTGSCTWTPPTYLEGARLRVEAQDESGDRGSQTVTIDVLGQLSGPQRLQVTVVGVDGAIGSVQAGLFDFCANDPGQPEVTCTFFKEPGEVQPLFAMPFPPFVFAGWSGNCTGAGDCTVTMNGSRRVTATFRPLAQFDFTVTVDSVDNGDGGVFVFGSDGSFEFCQGIPGASQTCTFPYPEGVFLDVQPGPAPGSTFLGWAGDCTGDGRCAVTMDQPRQVAATFQGPQTVDLTITVESLDNGVGRVEVSAGPGQPFQACEGTAGANRTCTFQYPQGTFVTIVQTAADNSVFLHWGGACDGAPPICQIPLDGPTEVTARFQGPQTLTITVVSVDNGLGRVDAGGPGLPTYGCDGVPGTTQTCTFLFAPGSLVTVLPMWASDSVFTGWSGACNGDGPCLVAMNGAQEVTATFRGPQTLTVTVESVDNGLGRVELLSQDGVPATCQGTAGSTQTCTLQYRPGLEVSLFPNWAPDSVFVGWSGACTGVGSCHVTMSEARHVTARFRGPQALTVQVNSLNGGSGRVEINFGPASCENTSGTPTTCTFAIPAGTEVAFTAMPHPQSVFAGWGGACSGTGPCVVTMSGAATVTALFDRPNRPPVAHAGGPYAGVRNQAIVFDGSGSSDPDGDPLTYAWDFGDGTAGTGVSPTHAYSSLGVFTVRLTVSDGRATSEALVSVTITNAPPLANAGPDRTVRRLTIVLLDGRASSDPDGSIATYQWRQVSGPAVLLARDRFPVAVFVAPNVQSTVTLEFELTVTDNDGAVATDRVRITVTR